MLYFLNNNLARSLFFYVSSYFVIDVTKCNEKKFFLLPPKTYDIDITLKSTLKIKFFNNMCVRARARACACACVCVCVCVCLHI